MKYPTLYNWIKLQRLNKDECIAIDELMEEQYTIDMDTARFARKLNGKVDPYLIDPSLSREEVDSMIENLDDLLLLRRGRFDGFSYGLYNITIWIPQKRPIAQWVALIINFLRQILWLPVLVFGIILFFKHVGHYSSDGENWGILLGLLVGAILHEIGHVCAGIAYGARVYEVGIGFSGILPYAYTLMKSEHCKIWQRISISIAGVEMNFLISGGTCLLAMSSYRLSGMFLMIAVINLFMGVLNLTLLSGCDGMALFANLLGDKSENLMDSVKKILLNKEKRKKICQQGFIGYVKITVAYILGLLQIGLPTLVLLSILEWIKIWLD